MKPPNILLIVTDQQRFDTVHALGNDFIRTPALDRLADEGTAFTRCYTPSPVCGPARASLHTGCYPWRTGVYENPDPWPWGRLPGIPDLLGDQGYRTHAIGKSHFMPDRQGAGGFQTRESSEEIPDEPGRDDFVRFLQAEGCPHVWDACGQRGDFYYLPQPGQTEERFHNTGWIGDRAVAFLRGQAQSGVPWMLYCGFIHPHPPWVIPPRWSKLYRSHEMPLPFLPEDRASLMTWWNHFQNRYKWRDRGIDFNLLRAQRAFYHAAISFVDFQIGRMLAVLDAVGQAESTMVVFTSDHGEYLGDYGCYGKRGMHDFAARVPLLVRQPGVFPEGVRWDGPVSLVDLLPTIVGEDHAAGADGVRLHCPRQDRVVYSQYQTGGRGLYMAASSKAKYVYSAADQAEFCFAPVADGRESASTPENTVLCEEAARLREALLRQLAPSEEGRALESGRWAAFPELSLPSNPDAGLLFQDSPHDDIRIPGYQDENRIRPQQMLE